MSSTVSSKASLCVESNSSKAASAAFAVAMASDIDVPPPCPWWPTPAPSLCRAARKKTQSALSAMRDCLPARASSLDVTAPPLKVGVAPRLSASRAGNPKKLRNLAGWWRGSWWSRNGYGVLLSRYRPRAYGAPGVRREYALH